MKKVMRPRMGKCKEENWTVTIRRRGGGSTFHERKQPGGVDKNYHEKKTKGKFRAQGKDGNTGKKRHSRKFGRFSQIEENCSTLKRVESGKPTKGIRKRRKGKMGGGLGGKQVTGGRRCIAQRLSKSGRNMRKKAMLAEY